MKAKSIRLRLIGICVGIAIFVLGTGAAHATRFTGKINANWSEPRNWEGEAGPQGSAEIIDAGVNLDTAVSISSIALGGSGNGGQIYNAGGGSLSVGTLTMTRGLLSGGSTQLNVTVSTLIFDGSGQKDIGSNVTINGGHIEWRGGPVFFDGTLNNNGLFEIFSDAGFGTARRTGVINNTGVIVKQAGTGVSQFGGFTAETNQIATTVNNKAPFGVVAAASGTIELGPGTSDGSFKVGYGKKLLFRYPHRFDEPAEFVALKDSVFTEKGSATIAFAEAMTFYGHIKTTAKKSLSAGDDVVPGGPDLELLDGASIRGGDSKGGQAFLEGSGRLLWEGGRIFGYFTFAEGFRTILTGPAQKVYDDDGVITNRGTMDWFGPGALVSGKGTFYNEGIFNLLAPGTFLADNYIYRPTFANIGTLNTVADGTNETSDTLLQNTGIVNIGGFGHAGILKVPAGYEQRAEGTLYMEVGGANAATPQFDQLLGNNTSINGTLNVEAINGFNPPNGTRFTLINSQTGKFARVFTPGGPSRTTIEYPANNRTELVSLSDAPIPLRLWGAGRDFARNETPDRTAEAQAVNQSVPQWSYGYRTTAGGTDLTLFTPEQHINDGSGLQGWIAPGQITLAVNTKNSPIIFNTGSGPYKPLLSDQIYMSPGPNNEYIVARWTAPAAGDYRITARWVDLDNHGGNGATAYLFKNGQAAITCTNGADCAFAKKFESTRSRLGRARLRATTLSLNVGDVVDFVLGSDGNNGFDATAFNAAVRRVPKLVITAPANETTVSTNQPINVTVDVDGAIPVRRVALLLDGDVLAVKEAPPYEFRISLDRGTHYLRAYAGDALNAPGTSASVKLRVTESASGSSRTTKYAKASSAADSTAPAATPSRKTYYCQQSGFWNEPSTWSPVGRPGINDSVVIAAGFEVTLTGETEVENLEGAGRINVANFGTEKILRVYGICSLAGELRGPLQFILPSSARFYTPGGTLSLTDVTFYNNGNLALEGTGVVSERSILVNNGRMSVAPLPGTQNPVEVKVDKFEHNGGTSLLAGNTVVMAPLGATIGGAVNMTPGAAPAISENGAGLITDYGAGLIGNDSNTLVGKDAGSLIGNDGNSLIGNDGNSLIGNDGSTLRGPDGLPLIGNDGSTLIGNDGSTLLPKRNVSADAVSAPSAAAASSPGQIVLTAGAVITGSGELRGEVVNQNGFITPGNSAGGIVVNGNYTQQAGGTLVTEVGGKAFFNGLTYDVFQVAGTATLGGNLVVKTINNYTPASGDAVPSLLYGSHTGNFATVSSNANVVLGAKAAEVSIIGPNPSGPRALNISTRLQIQGGDNALVAGFIVTGPAGSTKKVMIRGLGPSLAQFGVPGTIPDPLLELHTANNTVTNDNWQQASNTSDIPTGFAPSDSRESLIIATLAPGNYTAILKGAHGETGVGLAEVYDLDSASPSQLANISTRGLVQTLDNVLIGGFIIGGTQPTNVLVRAIGPSLTALNVQGALQDTILELHDANGGVTMNDNWRATQESEIVRTTIPPSHEKESAVLATLAPGNYTAVIRGKDNATGVALVEAYNLQ